MPEAMLAGKSRRSPRTTLAISGLVFAALCVFPLAAGEYQSGLLARYLVFGLFAMSFDLLWGYAGIMNFGHAAFFGLGAYSVGLVLKHFPFVGASLLAAISRGKVNKPRLPTGVTMVLETLMTIM